MTDITAQLTWQPEVLRARPAAAPSRIVLGGMGGSALAGHALAFLDTKREVIVHESYDLPAHPPKDALYVAVSYSGNTEETLSFARAVRAQGLPLAAVTSGGVLAQFAEEAQAPLVRVPGGVQPRNALGYMLRAVLAVVGADALLAESATVRLDTEKLQTEATALAGKIQKATPVLYGATHTTVVLRIWQTMLNETAKMPTFVSAVPASNHYEIQSYDPQGPHAAFAKELLPTFVRDPKGDPRMEYRLEVLEAFLGEQGYHTARTILVGESTLEQLFGAWVCATQSAVDIATEGKVDPEGVPFTEAFKKRL